MADKYFLVNREQDVYYFDNEKSLCEYLNEEGPYEPNSDEDRRNWEVLKAFPVPRNPGCYCPFTATDGEYREIWPSNAVLILKNDRIFVPKKRTHTKTVTVHEYYVPAGRKRVPAKKASPRKRASKKSIAAA